MKNALIRFQKMVQFVFLSIVLLTAYFALNLVIIIALAIIG